MIEITRICDVTGVKRDVKHYRIEVVETRDEGPDHRVLLKEADLGVRGLDRPRQRIADGLTRPKRRGRPAKEGEQTEPLFEPCQMCGGPGKATDGAMCWLCAGDGKRSLPL